MSLALLRALGYRRDESVLSKGAMPHSFNNRLRLSAMPEENAVALIIEAEPDGDPGMGIKLDRADIPELIEALQEFSVALDTSRRMGLLAQVRKALSK